MHGFDFSKVKVSGAAKSGYAGIADDVLEDGAFKNKIKEYEVKPWKKNLDNLQKTDIIGPYDHRLDAKNIDSKKFQVHHMISNKNELTGEHDLWKLAGMDPKWKI